jgi:hypothetical protein
MTRRRKRRPADGRAMELRRLYRQHDHGQR